MDRVTGQVTEDFFRSQLLEELGSTNFDDDAADTCLLYTSPSPRD